MISFKFFGENNDVKPKNRNEVREVVYLNLSILYDGITRPNFEAEVENMTDMVCHHLGIRI
jgi:hypothetical protein